MSFCSTNQPQLFEQKLTLSCSFRCDQVYIHHSYDVCHTLSCSNYLHKLLMAAQIYMLLKVLHELDVYGLHSKNCLSYLIDGNNQNSVHRHLCQIDIMLSKLAIYLLHSKYFYPHLVAGNSQSAVYTYLYQIECYLDVYGPQSTFAIHTWLLAIVRLDCSEYISMLDRMLSKLDIYGLYSNYCHPYLVAYNNQSTVSRYLLYINFFF